MNLGCYVRQMNLNTQKTKLEESKMERIKNFFNDESGAAAVEYGLLVGLIAVVIVAAVTALGDQAQCTVCDRQLTPTWCLLTSSGPAGRGSSPPGLSLPKMENRTGNLKISGPVFSETGQASPHDRISPGLAQVGMAGALEREKPFSPSWMILKS